MEPKRCKYCKSTFSTTRKDRSYCCKQCSNRYLYEYGLYEQEQAVLATQLGELKQEHEAYIEGWELKKSGKDPFEKENVELLGLERYASSIARMDDQQLLNKITQVALSKHEHYTDGWCRVNDYYANKSPESLLQLVCDYRKKLKSKLESKELESIFLGLRYLKAEKSIEEYDSKIKELERRMLLPFEPKSPTPPLKRKRSSQVNITDLQDKQSELPVIEQVSYGGGEIRDMEFNQIHLSGVLGSFIGGFDFNGFAVVLTGDAGAGKSYFSFHLAKLFLEANYRVKYYAMEESLSRPLQEKLGQYDIGNELRVLTKAKLFNVQRDAPNYDVLIIDSFSKLGAKAIDFDGLRQSYPKTGFICIFQKTTSGSPRGGTSIAFDATAVIDITTKNKERLATMKKSRYGTQGWVYSIDQDKIIKRS